MLVYEYKLAGSKKQYAAIDEAIRTAQFVRNKSLRLWMDGEKVSKTTCRPTVLYSLKNIPLLLSSTPKLVKPMLIVHGLLSNGSTTIARTRNQERKAIPSFSMTTAA